MMHCVEVASLSTARLLGLYDTRLAFGLGIVLFLTRTRLYNII